MAKIIEEGLMHNNNKIRCPYCKCLFEYGSEDIKNNKSTFDVDPQRGKIYVHDLLNLVPELENYKHLYYPGMYFSKTSTVICPDCLNEIHGISESYLLKAYGDCILIASNYDLEDIFKVGQLTGYIPQEENIDKSRISIYLQLLYDSIKEGKIPLEDIEYLMSKTFAGFMFDHTNNIPVEERIKYVDYEILNLDKVFEKALKINLNKFSQDTFSHNS